MLTQPKKTCLISSAPLGSRGVMIFGLELMGKRDGLLGIYDNPLFSNHSYVAIDTPINIQGGRCNL